MTFLVFHTQSFDKELEKFPNDFKKWIEKIEDQLVQNPYVGDPIRTKWFREKKFGKFRVYYFIYEVEKIVYMAGLSEKKDQQRVINTLWFLLDHFNEEIKNLIKK